jgi:hypothetical protein
MSPLGPGHRRAPAMRPVYVAARLSVNAAKLPSVPRLVEFGSCELPAFPGRCVSLLVNTRDVAAAENILHCLCTRH